MQQIVINVSDPDDILSGYGAGALVRLERDTSSSMSGASEITTIAVVSGTTQYEYWDPTGSSSHYYRTRYSKASPSVSTDYSDYSSVFTVGGGPQEYTTGARVKARLNITDTTDDVLFDVIADETNAWLEGEIGFPVGPIASVERIFDGSAVHRDEGERLFLSCYPWGVRSVTAVRTSQDEGATYTTQTASDVVLRPHEFERETGWPAFELYIKSTATWGWEISGFDANAVTGTWGWPAIPAELVSIATRVAIAAYRARGAGSGRTFAVGQDIADVAAEELSVADWWTIGKYHSLGRAR